MTETVDRKRRQSASMVTVADDGQGHQLWQWSGDGDGRWMGSGKGWEMGDGRVDGGRAGVDISLESAACGCGGVSGDGEW